MQPHTVTTGVSTGISTGIEAAIGAALLYNLAIVVQKSQAEQAETDGVRILGALSRRPLWLLGIAIQIGGFALLSFALTRAPVTLVQPIIASGIAFAVLFAALLLGERPMRRELAGMALAVTGVCLLIARPAHSPAIQPVAVQDLGLALGSAAVLMAGLLQLAADGGLVESTGLRAALVGSAAGLGQGMSDAMNRLAGAWLAPSVGWIPPAWIGIAAAVLLVVFGFHGFVWAQNGLRLYRANTVIPCILITQLLVPIAMASLVYGQALPADAAGLAIWAAAMALAIAGIALLSRAGGIAPRRRV
jgi:drug/metabolite transporter (DMT)-like permease